MHAVCRNAVLLWFDLVPAIWLTAGQNEERDSADVGETAEEVAAELQQHDGVGERTGGQPSNPRQEGDCAEHHEVPSSTALLLRPAAAGHSAVVWEAARCSSLNSLGETQASVNHSQAPGSGSDGGMLAGHGEMCRDAAGSSEAVSDWLQDAASFGVESRYSHGRQVCCFYCRPASAEGIT